MHSDERDIERQVNWRWVAEARLAALRMQGLPDETRRESALIARTTMLALTAYSTPMGLSPITSARRHAEDLAALHPTGNGIALHCAALLFFFDWVDGKEYYNLGLPQEFWSFGEALLSAVAFDPRPRFDLGDPAGSSREVEEWMERRANRIRDLLALVSGGKSSQESE